MNDNKNNQPRLNYHRLRVYWRAMKIVKWTVAHPIRRATLRNQTERAMDSVVLNISEAAGLDGKRGKAQFRIARGSLHEVVTAYEIAIVHGEDHPLHELLPVAEAVSAMLTKLCR